MYFNKFRLDGKAALVTGGTRGIGMAIADALGEAGARLVISGRAPRSESLEFLKAKGYTVDFIAADMEDPDAPKRLVEEAVRLMGGLDILINNAGVASHGDSENVPQAEWRRVMTTNLDSVFWCCQAALAPLRKAGGGVIVNVGSMSGVVSNIPQNQAAYNSSKAALHMMTKSLASEFAAENIRVNALAPGYIDTDMSRGGLENPEWSPIWLQMTPMGRAGTPEEVAAAALFLASPASSYVTGSVLLIDGGYTTR
jgi:NAD(P)-dependent dehydrogenase (short-subunit alcohol dehydrogenase family)